MAGVTVTLRPTDEQRIEWADAARRLNRPVPAFLTFAASWTAAYFREMERAKRPDRTALRVAEKARLGALLKASKQALEHLPRPFHSAFHGTLQDPAGDLRRAIDGVEEFLGTYGEYWE